MADRCNWNPDLHDGKPCPVHGNYVGEEDFDNDYDFGKWDDEEKKFPDKDRLGINDELDYENIEYPKGTSKEYTKVVNKKYEKALPILEELGIKEEDFGGKASEEGGFEDNSEEIMEKYVFEPFKEKYPNGNNEMWEKEYQPIYDAIESVFDKHYNDWYIKNNK